MKIRDIANSEKVSVRFVASLAGNASRSGLGFLSTLLLARWLSPAGYGNLMFLIGTFIAIRIVMDMGTSNAFYTFISQRRRGKEYYLFYFSWLGFQVFATSAFVFLIAPHQLVESIWLGHSRGIVVLAFLAFFAQQQLWQAVSYIGESERKTVRVQAVGLMIAVAHLSIIVSMKLTGALSIPHVLWLLIVEYTIGSVVSYLFVKGTRKPVEISESHLSFRNVLHEYARYCKPLVIFSAASFGYQFADSWLLQKFGGAQQQGFYQVAFQFSAVSLLATNSILRILWKEVADAWAKLDRQRVFNMYRTVARALFTITAFSSFLVIPWAQDIIRMTIGVSYLSAWPVLAILFFYPIHQSLGQVNGTMFLATTNTKLFTLTAVMTMALSVPASYFLLAPSDIAIPGLGLGAYGLALKTVAVNVLSVNLQGWILARSNNWHYEWSYQIAAVAFMLVLSFLSKGFMGLFWNLGSLTTAQTILPPFLLSSFLFALMSLVAVCAMPWLVGLSRERIDTISRRVLNYV